MRGEKRRLSDKRETETGRIKMQTRAVVTNSEVLVGGIGTRDS
jgi:hypothetical protein